MATSQKALVRSFWEERPCGDRLASATRGTPEYFAAIESAKDRLEPFAYEIAEFGRWEGKEVLEVGCGASLDLVYSWGVLHHTPKPGRALAEARRVLRPNGEALIMLHNRRSFFALDVWARYSLLRGRPASAETVLAGHLDSPGARAYTRSELRALFAAFARVEIRTLATPYDRRVAGPLADLMPRAGWFHYVRASR